MEIKLELSTVVASEAQANVLLAAILKTAEIMGLALGGGWAPAAAESSEEGDDGQKDA